jgi:hypothetical protein
MLPRFYVSPEKPAEWSIVRAAGYGAALGLLAGLFKIFGPLHRAASAGALELVAAIIGFALLCAGAAALRNAIARRLIWPELP